MEIKLAGFVRQGVVAETRGSNCFFFLKKKTWILWDEI
jgi:hypothetical protein